MLKVKTIGKKFLQRLKKSAQNPGIGWIENNQVNVLTYEEYGKQVEALSLGLLKHGLLPGQKVAILGKTCKEWHFFDLAVMCARGVVVPIYPSFLARDIQEIFQHSDSSYLIIEDEIQLLKIMPILNQLTHLKMLLSFRPISEKLLTQITRPIPLLTFQDLYRTGLQEAESNPHKFEETIEAQTEHELASLIYTSGTTGKPKGAMITHLAFSKMLDNVALNFQDSFGENDRSLVFLPLAHVLGRVDSFLPLIFGWQMVFAESIENLFQNIHLVHPTLMITVPRVLEKFYEKVLEKMEKTHLISRALFDWANEVLTKYHERLQLDLSPSPAEIVQQKLAYELVFSKVYQQMGGKLRYFVSGGAPMAEEIIKFLRNANLPVLEGYGLTETVGPCCITPLFKQIPGSVGLPVGDTQISFSAEGEILIKGEALFAGYYKDPQETAVALKDGFFHSGDIGEFTPEGFLKITDRKKDLIITSGGKNIAPQKIEQIIKGHKIFGECLVLGDRRPYLTAIVTLKREAITDLLEASPRKNLALIKDFSLAALATNPIVLDVVQKTFDEINEELPSFEKIKSFFIAPEDFTVENGLLTPSLKLRKKGILEKYHDEIEALYQNSKKASK